MIDDSAVRAALEKPIRDAVEAGDLVGIPLVVERTPYDLSASDIHLRARLFRGGERKITNARTVATGFLNIEIWDRDANGVGRAEAVAGLIKPLYPIDARLNGLVLVVDAAVLSAGRATTEDGDEASEWFSVPVQVDYQVDQLG